MVDRSLTKRLLCCAEKDYPAHHETVPPGNLRHAAGGARLPGVGALARTERAGPAAVRPTRRPSGPWPIWPPAATPPGPTISRSSGEISLTQDRVASIQDQVASLKKDNETLTAALVEAAKTERKLSQRGDRHLRQARPGLRQQEADVHASLRQRRGVLAQVLGALERMGLNPPPAILVRPDDALASVRSAILLGAVVPELRTQTEELAGRPQGAGAGPLLDRGRARTAGQDAERPGGREGAADAAAAGEIQAAGKLRADAGRPAAAVPPNSPTRRAA